MEKGLIIGTCYSMIRVTGKVVKFRLLDFDSEAKSITLEELHVRSLTTFDGLTEQELNSIRKIDQKEK